MSFRYAIALIALIAILSSCGASREVAYFENAPSGDSVLVSEEVIKPVELSKGDILTISISSLNQDANSLFKVGEGANDPRYAANAYQVKSDGTIDIPLIGAVEVSGKSVEQVEKELLVEFRDYLKEPSINVRLVNFKVTVLGEVNQPGVYEAPNAEMTLPEALGRAGDMTIFGKRTNILVVRKTGDSFTYHRFDLTDPQLMASKDIYLKNNDVIYVEPSKGKIRTENNVYRIVPIILSTLTFGVLLVTQF